MTLITISKRYKIIASAIAGILIITGYYLAVYQSFGYRSHKETNGIVLIVASLAIIEMMWLNMDRYANKTKVQIIWLTITGIVTIAGIMFLKQNYLENELRRNGITVNGLVVGFETDDSGRTTSKYARIRYECHKKQVLQRVEFYDETYTLNQNLTVLVLQKNPDIFRITELKK